MRNLWNGGAAGDGEKRAQELIIGEDKKYDKVLFKYEILSLIAYHMSLHDDLIESKIRYEIVDGLRKLYWEGIESLDNYEDIHSYVEGEFSKKFPELGKYLRILLSRNEQVHNDIRLFLIDELLNLQKIILEGSIKLLESENQDITIPGYTHYRQAMPIKWNSYVDMLLGFNVLALRNIDYLINLLSYPAYGYGSGFGSLSKFDIEKFSNLLGMKFANQNPLLLANLRGMDELNSVQLISNIMLFYSRISIDLILWSSECGFIEIPSEYITGSSLMPNKRNPDFLEMFMGYSAELISNEHLIQNLLLGKGTFYHREFQMAKWKVMDAVMKSSSLLYYLFDLLSKVEINSEAVQKIMNKSIYATQNSAKLVYNGVSWKESYEIIGNKILIGDELEKIEPITYKTIDKKLLMEKLNEVNNEVERRKSIYSLLLKST